MFSLRASRYVVLGAMLACISNNDDDSSGGGAPAATTEDGTGCSSLAGRPSIELRFGPWHFRGRELQDCFGEVTDGTASRCSDPPFMLPLESDSLVYAYEIVAQGPLHHLRLDVLKTLPGGAQGGPPMVPVPIVIGSTIVHQCVDFPGQRGILLRKDDLAALTYHFVAIDANEDLQENLGLVIRLFTVPADESSMYVEGGFLMMQNQRITVPPGVSELTAACTVPRDVYLWTLLSHIHSRGTGVDVFAMGGDHDGERVYTSDSWDVLEPAVFDPPLLIPAGGGLRWTCHWNNPSTRTLRFCGSADCEMCGTGGAQGAPGEAPFFYMANVTPGSGEPTPQDCSGIGPVPL